jgi:phosphate transport system substrate-binding protein
MNRRINKYLLISLCSFLSFFVTQKSFSMRKKIVVTGSSTVAPLALELAKAFEKQNPDVRIDIQTGGSARGVSDAANGMSHIGMVSRSLKKGESKILKAHTIARDGIGVILNGNNKVKTLSNKEIVAIYKKEITNWSQLGGENRPIIVVNKAAGRSTLELFLKYFKLKNKQVKADIIIGDNEHALKVVSSNQDSIGYVSVGAAEFSSENGNHIKLLPISGIMASTKTVKNGKFPISRKLNFVTKNTPQGVVKRFIDFARSKKANDVIKKQYFVPVAE